MEHDVLTVLVVDDELPLRQELRLFPWEAHRMELIGEAENGEEALRFCRDFSPDIVITDITMPVMNGLELFRTLKLELPHIQVILLTCHSEFKYAQEAIKLGAVEYLVKVTMGDDDLEQALRKAREAARHAKSLQRGETDRLRWIASEQLHHIVQQQLERHHTATCEPEPENGLEAFLQASFQLMPPFHIAALHVEAGKEGRLFLLRVVEDALTSLEQLNAFTWVPAEDSVYILMFRKESGNLQLFRSKLEAITGELYKTADRQLAFLSDAFRLYCVISEPVRQGADFAAVCRGVCEKPVAVFYDSACKVFAKQTAGPVPLEEPLERELSGKLRKAQWDREQLVRVIRDDFVKWAVKYRIVPEELRAFAAEWLRTWQREHSVRGSGWKAAQRIASAASINELAGALLHEIESSGGKKKCRLEIAEAKEYIEANLEKPITLTLVSDRVGLSPHYLSRLFREETGISFNDFVTRKRMEKATHLLQSTSLKVYEVAHEVGIPSYRYFSAVFREWTGGSPTELKKSQSDHISQPPD